MDRTRGQQISAWLKEYPEVSNYVILDDEKFGDFKTHGLADHVVYTIYEDGLTAEKVKETIEVLMGNLHCAFDAEHKESLPE